MSALSKLGKKNISTSSESTKIAQKLLNSLKWQLKQFSTQAIARISAGVLRFEIKDRKVLKAVLGQIKKRKN